jgi:hypothetical protein
MAKTALINKANAKPKFKVRAYTDHLHRRSRRTA